MTRYDHIALTPLWCQSRRRSRRPAISVKTYPYNVILPYTSTPFSISMTQHHKTRNISWHALLYLSSSTKANHSTHGIFIVSAKLQLAHGIPWMKLAREHEKRRKTSDIRERGCSFGLDGAVEGTWALWIFSSTRATEKTRFQPRNFVSSSCCKRVLHVSLYLHENLCTGCHKVPYKHYSHKRE